MSQHFTPPPLALASALVFVLVSCAAVAPPSRAQTAQSFSGFTLSRRVTEKDRSGREFFERTETLYVSSSGDWRAVATYPHGETVETIYLCGRGVFFPDHKSRQLVKISKGGGCPRPTTAERLEADPKFVRAEPVLDRLAYMHRRDVGYVEETYFAPELGPFPFKRVSYLEGYTMTEEPVSLTFGEPEPTQIAPADYTPAEQPVQEPKLSEMLEEKPDPQYPPEALSAGVGGEVLLQVTVDESGQVIRAAVMSNLPTLGAAALEAVYRARFKPVTRDSKAVKATGIVPYKFTPR